jgi:hypothetical protein
MEAKMDKNEAVPILEDMCNVDLSQREFDALTFAIDTLKRIEVGKILSIVSDQKYYCPSKDEHWKRVTQAIVTYLTEGK